MHARVFECVCAMACRQHLFEWNQALFPIDTLFICYACVRAYDVVFCLCVQWHADNIQLNGFKHYSFLSAFGPSLVSSIQRVGAGVYFNVPKLEKG